MEHAKRYRRVWRILHVIGRNYIKPKFRYKCDELTFDKGFIVVSNHVTNWDPLLVALSFRKNNLHFVASEHLFRMGFVSKLINWLVAPISRRKGSSGLDTAMTSLRTIKGGGAVCIFGEGECTWDGCNIDIVQSTGSLVRASGAPLVTYRIEGGYFTMPRWGNGKPHRGKMHGTVVNVYQPEELRKMKPDEITELINRDIYEDAWERQRKEMVKFGGRKRAEGIEGALFMCPRCHEVGTLTGIGNHVTCKCGLMVKIGKYGFFERPTPFETFKDWDKWQIAKLESGDYSHGDELFHDMHAVLNEVSDDHTVKKLAEGRINLQDDTITVENTGLKLSEISDMAVVRTNRLIFTYNGKYYEIKVKGHECLRKYWLMWKKFRADAEN